MAPIELRTSFLRIPIRRKIINKASSFRVVQTSDGTYGSFEVEVVPGENAVFVKGAMNRSPVGWAKLTESRIPGVSRRLVRK